MTTHRTVRSGSLTPEQASVRRRVREAAARLGLGVSFGEGRRETDVTLVVVKGPRSEVLRSASALVESLGLDVEVVRTALTPDGYEMVLSLMVPRARRRRMERERRASEIGDGESEPT
jgi:hypothetical protein